MATPVELPQLGNTVEECIITRWLKREGEFVSAGEMVAEIETDKTTFEITAPVAGTVLARFFDEGALVPVFTNILVIGNPGESIESYRPGFSRAAEETPPPKAERAPLDRSPAPVVTGRFSPRARRFAAEHDYNPVSIAGSGPGGRVLEKDVRRDYDERSRTSRVRSVVSGLRATIARRMRESLASTAQYTLNASADATGLLAIRARVKASPGLPDLTINDLVTFCTVQALIDMPELNAEFVDGAIVRHAGVNIAFAVDTSKGLMAPVVRNAQTLSVSELARRIADLGRQAVQGTISPDDLAGATFTISNLGALGIESFTPVINPPQVAILGVGVIQVRPVRRHGTVVFVDSIGLSLTCDHQVIDGAPGARFLQTVAEKIAHVEASVRL